MGKSFSSPKSVRGVSLHVYTNVCRLRAISVQLNGTEVVLHSNLERFDETELGWVGVE